MEGKIFLSGNGFSFDLQRFDYEWKADSENKWVYAQDSSSSIATIEGADSILTLTTSGTSATVSLTSTETLLGDYTAINASTATFPLYIDLASNGKIKTVIGGTGADSLIAGTAGVSLVGGNGSDSLVGGSGIDTFVYNGQGSDTISGYDTKDKFVLNTVAFPGVTSVKADGDNNLVLAFSGSGNSLTFAGGKNSTFAITKGDDTFYYTKDYIMNAAKTSVTLTPAATTYIADSGILSINGAAATDSLTITGNKNDNYIIGSATKANTIYGGAGNDFVSLNGGSNADVYVYSGGGDTITSLGANGIVRLSGQSFVTDGSKLASLGADKFAITFGNSNSKNSLTFDGSTIASLTNGESVYAYTPTAISLGSGATASVTLGGSYDSTAFDGSSFKLVDATAVGKAISIKGDDDENYFISTSKNGGTLDGGKGNNTLVGGSGKDYFFYSGDKDTIQNYTYGTDVVSLTSADLKLPTTFGEYGAQFANSNFALSLGADSVLTFIGRDSVAVQSGNDDYHYFKDRLIVNNERVTLSSEFTGKSFSAGNVIASIDASAVTSSLNIVGNADKNKTNSIIGAAGGGTITGGEGNDYLQAATSSTASLTLNGGADGNDTLVGGGGKNTFVYYDGADSIKGYNYNAGDLVSVVSSGGVNIADATISTATGGDLVLNFGTGDSLSINGGASATVSFSGNGGNYVYKGATFTRNQNSVTLTSFYADSIFGGSSLSGYGTITAIDASLFNQDSGISIVGNDYGNVIIGSATQSNSLTGGAGKDAFTGGNKSDLFYYSAGKDTINDFLGGSTVNSDKLSIAANDISSAKASSNGSRLIFTVGSKDNVVTLNGDNLDQISLQGGGFLTEKGYVKDKNFKLFANAKGRIDLKDDTLYSGAGIESLDASAANKQSITLAGASLGADKISYYTLAENKKKDVIEYNGGNVSIGGYESSRDRLNLGDGYINSFSISGGGDVIISVKGGTGSNYTSGATDNVISIAGGNEKELLIHQSTDRSNAYNKMFFSQAGVFLNKVKRPTEATITSAINKEVGFNATNYDTVKKITLEEGVTGTSIVAGNKNKTVIDASAASGVSLYGGAKNDKLLGSTLDDADDTFIYNGGKDIIQNFVSGSDSIAIGDFSLSSAKISAKSNAVSFKFNSKNTLNVKAASKASITSITFDETDYKFGKNWYGTVASGSAETATPSTVSLTSQFSGSFKTDDKAFGDDTPTTVDGAQVVKNLKYKGTSENESLVGGSSAKAKTNFRGGGGDDTLVGGASKDTFFYVKNTDGTTEIENFDLTNDKLKIASGAISDISTTSSGIQFEMNNKGNSATFDITSFTKNNAATSTPANFLIHTNNTYYWFANGAMEDKDDDGNVTTSALAGDLVTTTNKISKSSAQASGYDIIELGYATNLTKAGVAKAFSNYTFGSGGPSKKE